MQKRTLASFVAGAGLIGGALGFVQPASASTTVRAAAFTPTLSRVWSQPLPDSGHPIAMSSPTVATLQGAPAVVVGDESGLVYALQVGNNGLEIPGWPAHTGGIGVDSAPSSLGSTVFVGEGTQGSPNSGGYAAYSQSGQRAWFRTLTAVPGQSPVAGVDSGLTVADLQGGADVVSGSMGQYADAFTAWGSQLGGWPFLDADSNLTTPAVADLYSNGQREVVEGGDSTGGVAVDQLGRQYTNGGHIRVISSNGTLLCEYNTNQIVRSSPAVGEFLANHGVGITAGTGLFGPYAGASDTDKLLGLDSHCNLRWESALDGITDSSPSLVDALGNGLLQIAEGTHSGDDLSGSVYLINGSNGQTIWRTTGLGGVMGTPVSADLGAGYQDLVVASSTGAYILDGKSGAIVWHGLQGEVAFQNSPLVTHDPDGRIGITFAGYNGAGSEVVHYEVQGSNGGVVGEAGAWPMFHHDAQLTGSAGTPPVVITVPCHAPSSTPSGYWLAASDGGIFNYGNLPFCGSTGGIVISKPVVGIAGTRDGGGYWLVASDGGIFAFGDAKFHGSTGGVALTRPIVAMARTPDGGGYWLVASDGGVFAFGDAHFHGSTGGVRLNRPIVGMAPTPDGGGYWLVASDGGIFAFGDAHFHGSTGGVTLNKPVVGMASTLSGNGYWLVASDGGIFAFGDAKFHGSTGGVTLNKPVVAMQRTTSGNGYWLVASDGGIFAFGDAKFHGSTGGITLAKPVIGMAGY